MKDRGTKKGTRCSIMCSIIRTNWYSIIRTNWFKLFANFDCWVGSAWSSLIKQILRPYLAQGYKVPDGSAWSVTSAMSTGGQCGGTHITVCCSINYADLIRICLLVRVLHFFKMMYFMTVISIVWQMKLWVKKTTFNYKLFLGRFQITSNNTI